MQNADLVLCTMRYHTKNYEQCNSLLRVCKTLQICILRSMHKNKWKIVIIFRLQHFFSYLYGYFCKSALVALWVDTVTIKWPCYSSPVFFCLCKFLLHHIVLCTCCGRSFFIIGFSGCSLFIMDHLSFSLFRDIDETMDIRHQHVSGTKNWLRRV